MGNLFMVNILIGGDVSPIRRAEPLFCNGDASKIFTDLLPEFEQANVAVINLECSFRPENGKPILKDGPALGAHPHCVKGIKQAGIDVINLANNHCLDFGDKGLQLTINTLTREGIRWVGAGKNLMEASQMVIHESNGFRMGFIGMAEHEFSIAGEDSWGANPLDIIEFVRIVKQNQDKYDFLIVLLHGGKERYPYPTPRLMETCRFMVEEGANAVICQHSHCAGCYEIYKGAPIIYGQGNLVFDRTNAPYDWFQGFFVRLTIEKDLHCRLELIPYIQFQEKPGVLRMDAQEEKGFRQEIENRSRQILEEGFVRSKWIEFCLREKYTYFSRLYGYPRLVRVLNRKFHFSDWLYPKQTKLMVRNVVECETHREVLETLWHLDKK